MNQTGNLAGGGPGVEQSEKPAEQAPGYNEFERADDTGGETNQREPDWRPGDEPETGSTNSGMRGEGEPGRAHSDSTGGVEGAGNGT
jgi:hypothetical protein